MTTRASDLKRDRILLAVAGSVYLVWWLVVQATLPGSYNPIGGRLVVVAIFWLTLAASLRLDDARRAPSIAAIGLSAGSAVLTTHYCYLFHHNAEDFRWIVGCYITVSATVMCQFYLLAIIFYSALVLALGGLLTALHPTLQHTIFFPGLLTITLLNTIGIVSRIRTQRRLIDASSRFRSLLDATFEGIAVHDQGRIVEANLAFARVFGYAAGEPVGMLVHDFVHPSAREDVRRRIATDSESLYESLGRRRDGSPFPIEIQAKHFSRGGQPLRIAAVRDITERRLAQEEHVLAQAAQRSIQVRDEFISIASHELKTPLTAAKLAMQMATRRITESGDDQPILKVFANVQRHLDRLARLVEDMLDVSRVTAGKLLVHAEPLDLAELARDVAQSLELELSRARCAVTIDSAPSVAAWGDRFRLEQVITNLMTNAIKYGAGKPILVQITSLGGDATRYRIRDHGMGVPKASLQSIFNRFERAVSSRHISGLGLGLYISREIIEAHGGRIFAESEPGQGSTFTFELPAAPGS